jgi:hypothetical protein
MPATWVALTIAVLFLAPGLLADFLLGNWLSRSKRDAAEITLTALMLSVLIHAAFSVMTVPVWVQADRQGYRAYARDHSLPLTLLGIGILVVAPILAAILFGNLLRWERFVAWVEKWFGLRVRLTPKAWDFVWEQDRRFYAIVTFTDGSRVGGGWANNSWASGFPNDEDIYFEVVYSVTEEGRLGTVVPHTAGLLLKRADIQSIELINYDSWEASYVAEQQEATIPDAIEAKQD